jgi:hypothetical protein
MFRIIHGLCQLFLRLCNEVFYNVHLYVDRAASKSKTVDLDRGVTCRDARISKHTKQGTLLAARFRCSWVSADEQYIQSRLMSWLSSNRAIDRCEACSLPMLSLPRCRWPACVPFRYCNRELSVGRQRFRAIKVLHSLLNICSAGTSVRQSSFGYLINTKLSIPSGTMDLRNIYLFKT